MIISVRGNLFESPAQVLTNTVNCVGVIGKGVALEFKNKYPALFDDYRKRCDSGEVRTGIPYLWEDEHAQILNFPTKRDWRNPTQLDDIEAGLTLIENLLGSIPDLDVYLFEPGAALCRNAHSTGW